MNLKVHLQWPLKENLLAGRDNVFFPSGNFTHRKVQGTAFPRMHHSTE